MQPKLGIALAIGLFVQCVAGCGTSSPASEAVGGSGGALQTPAGSEYTASGGEGGAGASENGGAESESLSSGRLEIFSWWISGGERDALADVLKVYNTKYNAVRVINAAEAFADKARAALDVRLSQGNPPSTYQANAGSDLLRRTGALVPLDDLAAEQGWPTAFPQVLLDAVSKGGHVYAVPLDVHRVNSLFYDKRLFAEHQLTPPTNVAELNALVKLIKSDATIQRRHPEGVAPIALGMQLDWTVSSMVFENILPALTTPEFYVNFWLGNGDPSGPEIRAVLDEALFLYCGEQPSVQCSGYLNSDVDAIDWSTAVARLVRGSAAMAVMGDWAKGLLQGAGLVPDVDFGVVPFPGSSSSFVYTADAFPLPAGAPNEQAARTLLETFGSKEAQVVFSLKKGSIPARMDVGDDPRLDAMHRAVMRDFGTAKRVMAMSGLLPAGAMANLGPELKRSLQVHNIEGIRNYIIGAYASLKSP